MERSRRQFLFGGFRKIGEVKDAITQSKIKRSEHIIRPPGAIPESEFIEKCEKDCFRCLAACPTYVIQKVADLTSPAYRTAYIDSHISGCSFCQDFPCVAACTYGALASDIKPLGVAKVLASCITKQGEFCEICMSSCPEHHQSIAKNRNGVLQIDSERCVGCGKCVSACFLVPKAIAVYSADE